MLRSETRTQQLTSLISHHFNTKDAMELVKAGADPNVQNQDGDTLLHLLVKYDIYYLDNHNLDAITKLVKKFGADINIRNNSKASPLQVLLDFTGFETKTAMHFVALGADPNTKNAEGESLLHLLVKYNAYYRDRHNNHAIVQLVHQYRADINIMDASNRTPLQCLLDDTGFITDDAMLLVKLGAEPDTVNSKGDTLLHLLVKFNGYLRDFHNHSVIQDLVKTWGANVNKKNGNNMTPLQCVINNTGFLTVNAMQLVRLGADPQVTNNNGDALLTLLQKYNCYTNDNHNKDAIRELIKLSKANPGAAAPRQTGEYQYSKVSQWHGANEKKEKDLISFSEEQKPAP